MGRMASTGIIAAASSAVFAACYIAIRAVHDVSISANNVDNWLGFAGSLLAIPLSIGAAAWVGHRDAIAKDRKTVERVTMFVKAIRSYLDHPLLYNDRYQCVRHFRILAETIISFSEAAIDIDSSLIYHFKAFKINYEQDGVQLCDILINAPSDTAERLFSTKSQHLRASAHDCEIHLDMLQTHI